MPLFIYRAADHGLRVIEADSIADAKIDVYEFELARTQSVSGAKMAVAELRPYEPEQRELQNPQ